MAGRFAVLGLYLAGIATALPAPASHILHEERDAVPHRWIKRDRVPSPAKLPVRIGLTQSNLDNAHEHLYDVANPESPNYGKHWTSEQVVDMFKPADETIDSVREWLVSSGIDKDSITLSGNKAWLAFTATAERMEALLHTEYFEFEDAMTGGIMPACDRYHVPKHIQEHVDYITPGIKLLAPLEQPKEHEKVSLRKRGFVTHGPWPHHHWHHRPHQHPHPPPSNASDLSTCDVTITPACIRALYDIPLGSLADPSNSMGIFEAELQYWDQYDLNNFFANFTDIPNGTHPIDKLIDGGVARTKNISAAGDESMLDLEIAYPIVYPQTITVWNVDDIHYQTWANDTYSWGFNTLLDAIDGSYCTYCAYGECGDAPGIDPTYPDPGPEGYNGTLQCGVFKPTNVFSLSYGGQEVDVPIAYQKRQCNEYLKLGLQGISFIFASGDAGVGNYPKPYGDGCIGKGNPGNIFSPTWPVNCPWVTSVGATKVYPGYTVFEPESVVYDPAGFPYLVNYSSGGGFSNVYGTPDYQKSFVHTYLTEHNPGYPSYAGLVSDALNPKKPDVVALAGSTGGVYNRIGRGIPDVSANGDNGATFYAGNYSNLGGGTSMATPIFASVINRINEERIAAGKSSLGFLNPALYANPSMLNDITNGSNPNCNTIGFPAAVGWDPSSGLGTPNYPKMLEYFMSLQ